MKVRLIEYENECRSASRVVRTNIMNMSGVENGRQAFVAVSARMAEETPVFERTRHTNG
jgi:hypothetical protein